MWAHSRRYALRRMRLGCQSLQKPLRVQPPLAELSMQISLCGLLPELQSLFGEKDALATQDGTQEVRTTGTERLIVKMGVLGYAPRAGSDDSVPNQPPG